MIFIRGYPTHGFFRNSPPRASKIFLRCLERRSEFRSIKRIENAVEERGFREPVGTVRKERGAEHAIVFHAT